MLTYHQRCSGAFTWEQFSQGVHHELTLYLVSGDYPDRLNPLLPWVSELTPYNDKDRIIIRLQTPKSHHIPHTFHLAIEYLSGVTWWLAFGPGLWQELAGSSEPLPLCLQGLHRFKWLWVLTTQPRHGWFARFCTQEMETNPPRCKPGTHWQCYTTGATQEQPLVKVSCREIEFP